MAIFASFQKKKKKNIFLYLVRFAYQHVADKMFLNNVYTQVELKKKTNKKHLKLKIICCKTAFSYRKYINIWKN